jgi:NTE family protein
MQPDVHIENLPKAFAAVATDFVSGREVWLQSGSLMEAVRASTALPGVFPPSRLGEQWLVDGGLVNPVPVSVCRALGAEVVIAVNLNGDLTSRNNPPWQGEVTRQPATITNLSARLRAQLRGTTGRLASRLRRKTGETPGLLEVLAGALYIMQDRITRSRLAGDPPDVALTPCLGHIRLLDFDCGDEAIAEGYACVETASAAIERAVALS